MGALRNFLTDFFSLSLSLNSRFLASESNAVIMTSYVTIFPESFCFISFTFHSESREVRKNKPVCQLRRSHLPFHVICFFFLRFLASNIQLFKKRFQNTTQSHYFY